MKKDVMCHIRRKNLRNMIFRSSRQILFTNLSIKISIMYICSTLQKRVNGNFARTVRKATDIKRSFLPTVRKSALSYTKTENLPKLRLTSCLSRCTAKNGEDGTIQGLLELAEIPYTGCGVLSSALCMDKAMAKHIFDIAGIPQVDWRVITPQDMEEEGIQNAAEELGYPVFVKPSRVGSSFGSAKVRFPRRTYRRR